MPDLVFTPRATRDLDEIWRYSVERWDERQAAKYLRSIHAACDHLRIDPSLGRSCDEIKPGLKRHRIGSHIVFYRLRRRATVVVRILHQRMDFDRRL